MAFTSSSLPHDVAATHAPRRHHQEDGNDGAAMEPKPPQKHHMYQHRHTDGPTTSAELSPERRHQKYYYNLNDDRRDDYHHYQHHDCGTQNNNNYHKYFPHPGVPPMVPSLTTNQQTMATEDSDPSPRQQHQEPQVGHYHDIDYFFRESHARRNSHNVNPNIANQHYPSVSLKKKHHHRVMSGEDAADISKPNDLGSVQDFYPTTIQNQQARHFRPPIYMMNNNNIYEENHIPESTTTTSALPNRMEPITPPSTKSKFVANIPFGFGNSSSSRRKQWYYR